MSGLEELKKIIDETPEGPEKTEMLMAYNNLKALELIATVCGLPEPECEVQNENPQA